MWEIAKKGLAGAVKQKGTELYAGLFFWLTCCCLWHTIKIEVVISLVRRHVKAVLGTGEGKRPVAFVTQWGGEPGPLDIRVVRVRDLTDTHDFWSPVRWPRLTASNVTRTV